LDKDVAVVTRTEWNDNFSGGYHMTGPITSPITTIHAPCHFSTGRFNCRSPLGLPSFIHLLCQDQQTLSVMGQRGKIAGFLGHLVCFTNAAIDTM
jgi:hypothetical protein